MNFRNSVFLSFMYLYLYLFMYFVSLYVFLYLFMCISISLCVTVSFSMWVCLTLLMCTYLFLCVSLWLSVYFCLCLSIYLPVSFCRLEWMFLICVLPFPATRKSRRSVSKCQKWLIEEKKYFAHETWIHFLQFNLIQPGELCSLYRWRFVLSILDPIS